MDNDCYGFIVVGTGQTPDDAKEDFERHIKHEFKYIRGYKYWRRIPELKKAHDFLKDETWYKVVARVLATFEPTRSKEIDIDNLYPESSELQRKIETLGFGQPPEEDT